MKISDVPIGSFVMNSEVTMTIEELREKWEHFSNLEKRGWYVAECERQKIKAERVIDWIIDYLSEDGY